ncbi:Rossmann-like and DUF2520 domain-containing protein [Clostridium aminobutyricum]|uniref:DUF2520 domain-containing protein n=1 Tax=Clostridium aminobutyricum TaxID=33953 RepID=A0A939DAE5_CLOAM|nr:Rossmann-like and DUF2520 domain-containing protein [Clostridium aminobutyricum]MBN7774182.1 DUF2520 domain-containing protein [Clostridium aminobutyricum]
MKIGFVGAGKAGCSLGKYFMENEIPVMGYYSKTCQNAAEAAAFTNTVHFKSLKELVQESDILFITTPDGVIRLVWEQIKHLLPIKNKILCHCSGYLSSDVFSGINTFGAYGCSVHPILAMNSKQEGYIHLKNAFFTVEGNDYAVNVMLELLEKLNNSAKVISPQSKATYHTAASIASNSVIALVQLSVELLGTCGFTEQEAMAALYPLASANMANIGSKGIQGSLTGPVERFDIDTVKGHINCLTEDNKALYLLLSKKLLDIAIKKHPEKDQEFAVLQKLLEE